MATFALLAAAGPTQAGAPPAVDVVALGPSAVPMPPGTPPSPVEHRLGSDADPQAVWDVASPTMLVYAPVERVPARTAVIVLPGGGGRILGVQRSAEFARALRDGGIVAFVLKYRTQPLNLTAEQFQAQMKADPRIPPAPIGEQRTPFERINEEVNAPSPYRDMQVADVAQAVGFVRDHAARFGVDPARIAIVGQSNGSILVSEYLARGNAVPAIFAAGLLYGAPPNSAAPTPVPVYLASALDDALTIDGTIAMFTKWKAAGLPAELHVYQSGGHGFRAAGSSGSASWIADFANWIRSQRSRP